ncbi:MAG: phosphate-starvation-inducible PsiE family protein [Sedimenticola sp.]
MVKKLKLVEEVGDAMVELFHLMGLFVIGAAIIWASWIEVFKIIDHGGPGIKDILLLFIYLELGAMVGIYFRTKSLPVRFLIYIAITALTRVLAIDVKTMSEERMLVVTGSILLLSMVVVILRFGSSKFPGKDVSDG